MLRRALFVGIGLSCWYYMAASIQQVENMSISAVNLDLLLHYASHAYWF